jgi:uncharacterized protein
VPPAPVRLSLTLRGHCLPFAAEIQATRRLRGGITGGMGMPFAGDVRSRLQGALRAAMKDRDRVAVSALRSALAAIANAEAVPVPEAFGRPAAPVGNAHDAGTITGPAGAEVRRREVTEDEATAIAAGEAAERRAAAREYRTAGHADRAGRLLREAEVIESALYRAAHRDDA